MIYICYCLCSVTWEPYTGHLIAGITQTHFVIEPGLSRTSPGTVVISWLQCTACSTGC